MITKGIITDIPSKNFSVNKPNSLDNTCDVRIPLFESVTGSGAIIIRDAQILLVPGMYGTYKQNDVVWLAFDEGAIEDPVVIGKVFRGATTEAEEFADANSKSRGLLQQDTVIAKNAILPKKTVFSSEPANSDSEDAFTAEALYNKITTLETTVNELQTTVKNLQTKLTGLGY